MVGKRQRCADKRQRWDRRAISNQHKQSVKLMVYALHLTLFYIGNACCERDLCVLDTFGFAPSPFKNILKIYFDNIKRMEPVNFNSIITHYIYILFKEMTRWNRSSIMVAHVNMHVNLSATFCPFFALQHGVMHEQVQREQCCSSWWNLWLCFDHEQLNINSEHMSLHQIIY